MITLIVTIAFAVLIAYLITRYIPMPEWAKRVIWGIVIVCLGLYVLAAFGIRPLDVGVPQLN